MKILKILTLFILILLLSCSFNTTENNISDNSNNLAETKQEISIDTFLGTNTDSNNNDTIDVNIDTEDNTNNIEDIKTDNNTENSSGDNNENNQEDENQISNNSDIEDILIDTENLLNTDLKEDTQQLETLESTTEEDIADLVDTLFEIEE